MILGDFWKIEFQIFSRKIGRQFIAKSHYPIWMSCKVLSGCPTLIYTIPVNIIKFSHIVQKGVICFLLQFSFKFTIL